MKIRFYDSSEKSLILLKTIRYIIKNARNKKNFINYIFNIVFNDKNINIIIIDIAQILLAYKHMNDELKRDLFKFKKISTMFSLLEKLRHQKNI